MVQANILHDVRLNRFFERMKQLSVSDKVSLEFAQTMSQPAHLRIYPTTYRYSFNMNVDEHHTDKTTKE